MYNLHSPIVVSITLFPEDYVMQIIYELNEQVYMYDSEASTVTTCPKTFFQNTSSLPLEQCDLEEVNKHSSKKHLEGEI